jgi:uncharacterized protein (TIGR02147 family)
MFDLQLTLYKYEDYRVYLKDYFSFRKKSSKDFTHRTFAKLAGFSSSSFCLHVMQGHKNLSDDSIQKLLSAMNLEGAAARYFEALVQYNQAKTLHDREFFFSELNKIRRKTLFYRINKHQFILYSEWYFSVIRELAVYSNWNGDYQLLGSMVVPPLSAEKAKKAVDSLVEAGLLIYNEDGTFRQNSPVVSADGAPAVIVNKLKKDFMLKALEAEEKFRKPAKYSSSATISMSTQTFNKAKGMIDELRQQLLAMAMNDNEVDQVFQVNFQMFPLSEPIKKYTVNKNVVR